MPKSNTTSYRGAKETSSATSLSVYLRREVEALHGSVDHAAAALARSVTPSGVHDTRVAARRLRVLLQVYRGAFDSAAAKPFKRALARLAYDLEPARDADVTRRAIENLTRNPHTLAARQSRALREHAAREYALAVREALGHAGKDPKRLHRIRLKIKSLRYLLENCLSKAAIVRNAELRRLRQLQGCLGDLHDEENLLETLRTNRTRPDAAGVLRDVLKARKKRHLQEFKSHRNHLLHLWHRAAAGIIPRR